MRRLKAFASLAVTVFLLFAPPGTLIFIAVVIGGWLGWQSAVAAGAVCICALGVTWMLARARRGRKSRSAIADGAEENSRR
jgi:hypothetical protein